MNFKLGEKYIVDVTENGIIPLMEFDRNRWFDKDCDNLDFLTDEEKIVVVNDVLDKIRAEIKALSPEPTAYDVVDGNPIKDAVWETLADVLHIIDKYRAESEDK